MVSDINKYERFVAGKLKWPANFAARVGHISHRVRFASALAEELGEYNGKLKRFLRGDYNTVDELRGHELGELGDILFYAVALCNACGYSLDEVIQANRDKLDDREARGVLLGEGDKR